MARLAVIIPHYNHERLLPEAVRSVMAQTRPPDDLIVVDDGSTPESLAAVEELAQRTPGLRVIRHERNCGVIAAANTGLAATTAEYVTFLAADDAVAPSLYARAMSLLEQHPAAGLACTLAEVIDSAGAVLGLMGSAAPLAAPGYIPAEEARRYIVEYGPWVLGSGCIYRREAFDAVGGLREDLRSAADAILNMAIPLRFGACFIPAPLALLRITDRNYSAAVQRDVDDRRAMEGRLVDLMVGEYAGLFPAEFIVDWQARAAFRLEFDVAAWSVPSTHGRPIDPPSGHPLRYLLERGRADVRLAMLLWRHRRAWRLARRQSARLRASLSRAGLGDRTLY